MLEYGFAVEIIRDKSIKVSGVTYYDSGEIEEEIGVFTFDKILYRHRLGEYLAVKRPRKSRIWGDYRFKKNGVKK
jgi:hypothetical protein